MKKITFLLIALFTVSLIFGQNLIVNGDFETGESGDPVPSWGGFKNRIATDDITSAQVGQIENGDGSLFQEFNVTPGEEYAVEFDYRWITTASANNNLVVRIKNAANLPTNLELIGGTVTDGYALNTSLDEWFTGNFSFVVPAGITGVRLLMFKGNGNKPLNLDNVSVTNSTMSLTDLTAFNFKTYPNPANAILNVSATSNITKIEVYSILGQKVLTEEINSRSKQINISDLTKGVYIIKTYINKTVGSFKFIKG